MYLYILSHVYDYLGLVMNTLRETYQAHQQFLGQILVAFLIFVTNFKTVGSNPTLTKMYNQNQSPTEVLKIWMSQFLEQKGLSIERQRLKKKKIGTGVNFINILCASFLYESASRSFSLLHFGFVIFWQKDIGKKIEHKMLMKLTTDVFNLLWSCTFCLFFAKKKLKEKNLFEKGKKDEYKPKE